MATPPGYVLVKKTDLAASDAGSKPAPLSADVPSPESKESKYGVLQKGGSRSEASGRSASKALPPPVNSNPVFRHVYRYVAQDASATAKVISTGNLIQSLGSMSVSTTDMYSVISACKINKITIWSASASGTAAVYWDSYTTNTNMPDVVKTKPIPTGITVTGGCVYVPPKNSKIAWWQSGQGSSDSLFAISAPVGSIVDVDVTCSMQNVGTNITGTGYTGLTLGIMYYPALDGRSTNDFAPYGRTNAT